MYILLACLHGLVVSHTRLWLARLGPPAVSIIVIMCFITQVKYWLGLNMALRFQFREGSCPWEVCCIVVTCMYSAVARALYYKCVCNLVQLCLQEFTVHIQVWHVHVHGLLSTIIYHGMCTKLPCLSMSVHRLTVHSEMMF